MDKLKELFSLPLELVRKVREHFRLRAMAKRIRAKLSTPYDPRELGYLLAPEMVACFGVPRVLDHLMVRNHYKDRMSAEQQLIDFGMLDWFYDNQRILGVRLFTRGGKPFNPRG